MAQRGILEVDAKRILSDHWSTYFGENLQFNYRALQVESISDLNSKNKQWLNEDALVCKPDMLFGERGKNNLVLVKKDTIGDIKLEDVKAWIGTHLNKKITLKNGTSGELRRFIIEPFCPHDPTQEYYISIRTEDAHDVIALSTVGGVNIMENWDMVTEIKIPIMSTTDEANNYISTQSPDKFKENPTLLKFVSGLYQFFVDLHFSYFEINPFVLKGTELHILDTVAKLDDTAGFIVAKQWGKLDYSAEFGQVKRTDEERYIQSLDESSGASLKLSILNPKGRVWTLVAGGGASVAFADTIADACGIENLANYGEYSGNPSHEETYEYAKTVLDLMTRENDPNGKSKVLLIGGAIANFTDVAKTFAGIIDAFKEYAEKMNKIGVKVYVRRGGPNYEIGLKNIRKSARELNIPIEVYGPETHMTEIVALAKQDVLLKEN